MRQEDFLEEVEVCSSARGGGGGGRGHSRQRELLTESPSKGEEERRGRQTCVAGWSGWNLVVQVATRAGPQGAGAGASCSLDSRLGQVDSPAVGRAWKVGWWGVGGLPAPLDGTGEGGGELLSKAASASSSLSGPRSSGPLEPSGC